MSSVLPPSSVHDGPSWLPRWLAPHRRRIVASLLTLVVVVIVVLAVTDPFASSSPGSGVTDNSSKTSTTKVVRENLSSQTSESATLGYAGHYSVALPTGTSTSALSQARSTAAADEQTVTNAEAAFANAKAMAGPERASTLLAARAAVSSDETALASAKVQLASDEGLSCPSSSSSTVTTVAHVLPHDTTTTTTPASAPSASTGAVDETTSTSTKLMGTVDPNGTETTYYFEYGTSPNYGQATSSVDASSGTSELSISTVLSGLLSGQTYHYRLVAINSLGVSYGQDATFTTNAAPSATTGIATTVSATSETFAGTVDSNGTETTYYFEYGTTSSFGEETTPVDAGAGTAAISVSATITGLKANTTYDYALVATSSLGTSVGVTEVFQVAASSCVAQSQVITEDNQALSQAKDTLREDELDGAASVTTDQEQLTSDETSAASAEQALSTAEAQETNPSTTFTALPDVGKVFRRGQSVYSLDGKAVPLFYGATPLYRALHLGEAGPDVTELQDNLIALGFGSGLSASGSFNAATESALEAWQRSLNVPETGVLALGDVVIEPGPIEVADVSVTSGSPSTSSSPSSSGATVLTATSTKRVVTIALGADQESEVKVGDKVTITLPNNDTTPGVISSVGTVATTPSGGGGPTISVQVRPTDPKATGSWDEAPVSVTITTASVTNALVVPVDSLLAQPNGRYAVEVTGAHGSHHLVAVSLGLFDDDAGLVQVTDTTLVIGERVVVPNL
jgi:hypothetical protein